MHWMRLLQLHERWFQWDCIACREAKKGDSSRSRRQSQADPKYCTEDSFYLVFNRHKKIRINFRNVIVIDCFHFAGRGADHKMVHWWIGFSLAHRLLLQLIDFNWMQPQPPSRIVWTLWLVLKPRLAYKLAATHRIYRLGCCVACAFACNLIGLLRARCR